MGTPTQANIEKRRYFRAPINISVKVRRRGCSGNIVSLKGLDLSEGGIRLSSEKMLNLARDLTVSFEIPLSPYIVEIPSEAIWTKRLVQARSSSFGLRFKETDREQSINVKRLLWQCESYIEKRLEELLQEARNVNLEIANLIKTFFVKDVRNYLGHFNQMCQQVDRAEISDKEGQTKINELSHKIVETGEKLALNIGNKILIKGVKGNFREMVGSWAYESEIMKRGFEKPRGYPGDYKSLEQIYDNKEITPGMGRYYDRFFLDNLYAEAVRSRREKIYQILKDFLKNNRLHEIKILNLACGSCREIKDLFEEKFQCQENITFTCVDHDENALEFSKGALVNAPSNIKIKFLKENILAFPKEPEYYSELLGRQNFIYSVGLADYLPDRILKSSLKFWFGLLATGNQLVIAHKDKNKDPHAPVPPDWFCDWKFVPRTEEDLVRLIGGSISRSCSVRTERDKTGKIIFLFISKV